MTLKRPSPKMVSFCSVACSFLVLALCQSVVLSTTTKEKSKIQEACEGFQCLHNYVHTPDPAYKYSDTGRRISEKQWTGYILNMTSQTWLTKHDSDRSVWWHILVVIIPKKIQHTDFGFLWITGGDNKNGGGGGYDGKNEDIIVAAYQAVHNGIVAAALFQVPNQPVLFKTDPIQKQRSEDATIAFT